MKWLAAFAAIGTGLFILSKKPTQKLEVRAGEIWRFETKFTGPLSFDAQAVLKRGGANVISEQVVNGSKIFTYDQQASTSKTIELPQTFSEGEFAFTILRARRVG